MWIISQIILGVSLILPCDLFDDRLTDDVLDICFRFFIMKNIQLDFKFSFLLLFLFKKQKHVLCFYRVTVTQVEVWENEKCCGNTSCRRVFPQLFRSSSSKLFQCFYNSIIETRRTCFLFILENTATRKRKTTSKF